MRVRALRRPPKCPTTSEPTMPAERGGHREDRDGLDALAQDVDHPRHEERVEHRAAEGHQPEDDEQHRDRPVLAHDPQAGDPLGPEAGEGRSGRLVRRRRVCRGAPSPPPALRRRGRRAASTTTTSGSPATASRTAPSGTPASRPRRLLRTLSELAATSCSSGTSVGSNADSAGWENDASADCAAATAYTTQSPASPTSRSAVTASACREVGDDEDAAAVPAVDEDPGERAQEDRRRERRGDHPGRREDGSGAVVDDVGQRGHQHPVARHRHQAGEPQEAEVAPSQDGEHG